MERAQAPYPLTEPSYRFPRRPRPARTSIMTMLHHVCSHVDPDSCGHTSIDDIPDPHTEMGDLNPRGRESNGQVRPPLTLRLRPSLVSILSSAMVGRHRSQESPIAFGAVNAYVTRQETSMRLNRDARMRRSRSQTSNPIAAGEAPAECGTRIKNRSPGSPGLTYLQA